MNFYDKCAIVLGTEHLCDPFMYSRRTRWNNRDPGSGRFPGFGIIRHFGTKIHVALYYPFNLNKVFDTEEEVLDTLSNLTYNNILTEKEF